MTDVLNPEKARIFRITHRENLPWILDNGLHAPNGLSFDPNHRSIGSVDLIQKRTTHLVNVGPGGTLNDYILFYFTPFSMMMYNIHTGCNVARVSKNDILILVSSLRKVYELGIPFVFTDQHALRKTASYFTKFEDLERIDWPLLNQRDFKYDPDDLAKTDRYQAEALIWRHLPLKAILGIATCNDEVDAWLKAQMAKRGANVKTKVQRSWYF